MGIPFYFRTVTRQHPHLIAKTCGRNVVHGLYLDLNCAIHQCARDAIVQASATNPIPAAPAIEVDIIDKTIAYIDKIVAFARPTRTLFVAIDGPPPRAKMVQQRKRRFVSSWRNKLAPNVESIWDRNAITPGTRFMASLSTSLASHFEAYRDLHPQMEVHFHDSNDPGEGEAKIFRRIREETQRADVRQTNTADVVYGLDADLIMLSLIANAAGAPRPLYLLREPAEYDLKHTDQPFMYFDTRSLATIMTNSTIDVRDYVVLCFLMGNDFIPPLSYLKINNNGIDHVIKHYKAIQALQSKRTLVVKGDDGALGIDYEFLLAIIERIKDEEDTSLAAGDAAYYAFVPHRIPSAQAAANDPNAAQTRIDNYPSCNKFPNVIRPNTTGWRQRYYYNLFFKMNEAKDIDGVCANYLEGIQWTFDYYFGGNDPSWGWYYKNEYSPTALDLFNHMIECSSQSPRLASRARATSCDPMRYDPFEPARMRTEEATALQLLMVLPPESFHLLPNALRHAAVDESVGLMHMYPSSFYLTTYLKKFLWECHPMLPLVDMAAVAAFVSRSTALTIEEFTAQQQQTTRNERYGQTP
jgi:5'-3' exonuclease